MYLELDRVNFTHVSFDRALIYNLSKKKNKSYIVNANINK